MTNKTMPEIPFIDTAELEASIKSLELALQSLKEAQYAAEAMADANSPQPESDEPTDYESVTHGY